MAAAATTVRKQTRWHDLTAEYTFEQYCAEFGKQYVSVEERVAREARFTAQLATIRAHNAEAGRAWKMGVNVFTDLAAHERATYFGLDQTRHSHAWLAAQASGARARGASYSLKGGLVETTVEPDVVEPAASDEKKKTSVSTPADTSAGDMEEPVSESEGKIASAAAAAAAATAAASRAARRAALPASVDWRAQGKTPPVLSQGGCGSCYLHAGVSTLEARLLVAGAPALDLSPQIPLDCMPNPNNCGVAPGNTYSGNCRGGTVDLYWSYVAQHGIGRRADYPYTGGPGACAWNSSHQAASIAGFTMVASNDEDALMAAVAQGPVAVSVMSQVGGAGVTIAWEPTYMSEAGLSDVMLMSTVRVLRDHSMGAYLPV